MSNASEGAKFERELSETLAKHGWWVHCMVRSSAGQPADLIAIRFGRMALIDCKVLSSMGRGFPLSRIEDNQHTAMQMFTERTMGFGWFAIKTWTGQVFMIRYAQMVACLKQGMKSIPQTEFGKYGVPLEKWMEGDNS